MRRLGSADFHRVALAVAPVVLAAVIALAVGCATVQERQQAAPAPSLADDKLDATLWVQTSAEYLGAARQAYRLAGIMLRLGLEDPRWSASLEQHQAGGYADLPPAVILDVDETVLDNSAYQARLILDGEEFSTPGWQAWVREEKAVAVPGALEFVRGAREAGVAVFYVTNRRHEVEPATRANLERLGFPVSDEPDTLLTRDERPEWGGDKGSRREHVAAGHRIVLLVGDNYGDFASGVDVSVSERLALAQAHAEMWGSLWILLPNPQYGSWDGALIDFQYGLPLEDRRRLKRQALDAAR